LRDIQIKVAVLISGHYVTPDFDWIINDHIEISACFKHGIDINDHIIELRHSFEGGQEALVGSLRSNLGRSVLQCDDESV